MKNNICQYILQILNSCLKCIFKRQVQKVTTKCVGRILLLNLTLPEALIGMLVFTTSGLMGV